MSFGIDPSKSSAAAAAPAPGNPAPAAPAPEAAPTLGADQAKLTTAGKAPQPLLLHLSDVDQAVTDQLTPNQAAAYLKLPPNQRWAFSQAFLQLGQEADKTREGRDFSWSHLQTLERARFELADMLVDKRALAKDRDGVTILERLGQFFSTPLDLPDAAKKDPQGYRTTQMAHVISHVYHRTAIHQGTWSTCGGTCAQIDMACNFPAQYVSFALGILSKAAQGTLPDGRVLKRPADSLNGTAKDERPAVSRMVQSTFMKEANAGDYAAKDADKGMDPFGGGKIHTFVRGEEVRFLVDSDWKTIGLDSLTRGVRHEFLFEAIQSDLARQKSIGRTFPLVPVSLHWDKDAHQVMVTHMTDSRVYVVNPHPDLYTALKMKKDHREGVELKGPKKGLTYVEGPYPGGGPGPVRIYADGSQSFPRAVFDKQMYGAIVEGYTASKYEHLDRFDPPL